MRVNLARRSLVKLSVAVFIFSVYTSARVGASVADRPFFRASRSFTSKALSYLDHLAASPSPPMLSSAQS